MAIELPYFRFTVHEWQNGNISLESFELQGLFISICGYYWLQDCNITLAMLQKKYSLATVLLQRLIELNILKHENRHDKVQIVFLNKQYDLLSEKRKSAQERGSKGGKAKAKLQLKGSYKDKDKDKDKDKKAVESFSTFEKAMKLYGGKKRGVQTEFENLKKKHKDWRAVIPTFEVALKNQIREREFKKKNNQFTPEWKNLQTWINQRCWEEGVSLISTKPAETQEERLQRLKREDLGI